MHNTPEQGGARARGPGSHAAGAAADDHVAVFQLDGRPVRGRIAQLGPASLAPILARHDYPESLARILGEAATLACLVGSSLKFDGKLLVQAEGDGPVSMLVAEYSTNGALRAYARHDAERYAKLERLNKGAAPHMPQLFGAKGSLALIIIQDNPAVQPYQGVVPLSKATLAECAGDYFAQSEQVPSVIRMAVAEHSEGAGFSWRSGGMLVQRIAADDSRGDTDDAWREAEALMATVTDAELADPQLGSEALLYRLFHETGVRLEGKTAVADICTCSEERLRATLASMPDESLRELADERGALPVDCQFCARHYDIPLKDVTAGAAALN